MPDPSEQFDGFSELRHGMNAGRNPMMLPETQCARAINVQFRGGCARTRPGWVKEPVNLPEGVFQGCGRWHLETGDFIVFVIEGRVLTFNVETLEVLNHGYRVEIGRQCDFTPANRFMLVRDGASTPVVLEYRSGTIKRRPVAGQSLPRGLVGVFAHGRYHLVPAVIPSTGESGRDSILSGDIQEIDRPTTLLRFSESDYLSEGGANALPMEMGEIGALGVFRNAASGTGMGQVVTLAENGVCAFDFSLPREMWKDQALSQVLFVGGGCVSPWSLINVNDDLVYRSQDGLRVLRYTVTQSSGGSGALSNTPMSLEVDSFLQDDRAWLGRVSAALCDNRLHWTCGGREWEGVDVAHTEFYDNPLAYYKGLISWDLAAAYYSGAQGVAAYEGLWTGLDIAATVSAVRTGERTLFAFDTQCALYSLSEDALVDACDTSIESRIETRSFAFGDLVSAKSLNYVELWMTDVQTTTTMKVWYRPHGYQLWKELGERTVEVPAGSLAHAHRRFRFGIDYSGENCDPVSGEPLWIATGFQVAVQWTGNMVLERCRVSASLKGEAPPQPCDESGQVLAAAEASGEVLNDYSYEINCEAEFYDYDVEDPWPVDDALDPGIEDDEYDFDPVPPIDDPDGTPVEPEPGFPTLPGYPGWPSPPPEGTADPDEPDPEDTPPSVGTRAATDILETSATLNGRVTSLGSWVTVNAYFRWRVQGTGVWTETTMVGVTGVEDFSLGLTGLTEDTTYEFQAMASYPGDYVSGSVLTFTTPAAVEEPPDEPDPDEPEEDPQDDPECASGTVVTRDAVYFRYSMWATHAASFLPDSTGTRIPGYDYRVQPSAFEYLVLPSSSTTPTPYEWDYHEQERNVEDTGWVANSLRYVYTGAEAMSATAPAQTAYTAWAREAHSSDPPLYTTCAITAVNVLRFTVPEARRGGLLDSLTVVVEASDHLASKNHELLVYTSDEAAGIPDSYHGFRSSCAKLPLPGVGEHTVEPTTDLFLEGYLFLAVAPVAEADAEPQFQAAAVPVDTTESETDYVRLREKICLVLGRQLEIEVTDGEYFVDATFGLTVSMLSDNEVDTSFNGWVTLTLDSEDDNAEFVDFGPNSRDRTADTVEVELWNSPPRKLRASRLRTKFPKACY